MCDREIRTQIIYVGTETSSSYLYLVFHSKHKRESRAHASRNRPDAFPQP
jgi:hypothetical protein